MKTKLIAVLSAFLALGSVVHAAKKNQPPVVPAGLEVPADARVSFRAYAIGVQIYTATLSTATPGQLVWTFKGPEAVLFDEHEPPRQLLRQRRDRIVLQHVENRDRP
jgi:hypothetical protein